jgi:mannose-6-phosphate isomerase-like protein (cupin superfamily)
MQFATGRLSDSHPVIAPDGSEVRVLVGRAGGGLAHFRLNPDDVSVAVHHRSVEELWYVVSGRGQMWRRQDQSEEIVVLEPGVALTIPVGTHFQFRADGAEALDVIGVTMPPWPGENEAVRSQGPWPPTVAAGPGLAEGDG